MNIYDKPTSQRRTIGIVSVVVLHILMVWALISGLARDVVQAVKNKVEVQVIEDVPPPPPPPPPKVVMPKTDTLPTPVAPKPPSEAPAQVIKSEVSTANANAVTAKQSDVPVKSAEKTADVADSKPKGVQGASGNCSGINYSIDLPAAAADDEITPSGTVVFTTDGSGRFAAITGISINGAGQHEPALKRLIQNAVRGAKCDDPNASYKFGVKFVGG